MTPGHRLTQVPGATGFALCWRLKVPTFDRGEGRLRVLEFGELPFRPARWFEISCVPGGTVRGGHAHRTCWQLFVPQRNHGAYVVEAPNGESVRLDLDERAEVLVVPPVRWVEVLDLPPDAILSVHASEGFDPADYVHDKAEFRALAP